MPVTIRTGHVGQRLGSLRDRLTKQETAASDVMHLLAQGGGTATIHNVGTAWTPLVPQVALSLSRLSSILVIGQLAAQYFPADPVSGAPSVGGHYCGFAVQTADGAYTSKVLWSSCVVTNTTVQSTGTTPGVGVPTTGRVTDDTILALMYQNGNTDPQQLTIGLATCLGESGGVADVNAPQNGGWGLWQINIPVWGITAAQADDPVFATQFVAQRINPSWSDWTPWGAFTNGSYQGNLGEAQAAVAAFMAAPHGIGGTNTVQTATYSAAAPYSVSDLVIDQVDLGPGDYTFQWAGQSSQNDPGNGCSLYVAEIDIFALR